MKRGPKQKRSAAIVNLTSVKDREYQPPAHLSPVAAEHFLHLIEVMRKQGTFTEATLANAALCHAVTVKSTETLKREGLTMIGERAPTAGDAEPAHDAIPGALEGAAHFAVTQAARGPFPREHNSGHGEFRRDQAPV